MYWYQLEFHSVSKHKETKETMGVTIHFFKRGSGKIHKEELAEITAKLSSHPDIDDIKIAIRSIEGEIEIIKKYEATWKKLIPSIISILQKILDPVEGFKSIAPSITAGKELDLSIRIKKKANSLTSWLVKEGYIDCD